MTGRVAQPGASAIALGTAFLVASPVLVGLAYSVAASAGVVGAGASGPSLERITRVLAERATWSGLGFTVWVAGLSTLFATAAAAIVAVIFRGAGVGDRVARALAVLPLSVPHLVAGALGVWILSQSGLLARALASIGVIGAPGEAPILIYDRPGVGLIALMAWKESAFLLVVATALLASRAQAVEEAARTLGAGPVTTFMRVTFPILWRGMLPAVIAVFIFVAGSYEVAALLAPSDPLALPLIVADRAADPDLTRRGDAYVASILLLALAAVAVAAHEWARARWGQLE